MLLVICLLSLYHSQVKIIQPFFPHHILSRFLKRLIHVSSWGILSYLNLKCSASVLDEKYFLSLCDHFLSIKATLPLAVISDCWGIKIQVWWHVPLHIIHLGWNYWNWVKYFYWTLFSSFISNLFLIYLLLFFPFWSEGMLNTRHQDCWNILISA